MAPRTPLPCGIYAPTVTFFHPETEDLDIATIKSHAVRLAKAGLAGIVAMGSNGEAVHCTREEKLAVTRATREALDSAGFPQTPVLIGATEGSVRGTIELTKLAYDAGADYALVLPPSYYRAQMDLPAITAYFQRVADQSPLPIVVYNYPGAVSGIDLDSDALIALAQHPNIVGTKFTCGNTGKLTRVALAARARTPATAQTAGADSGYMAFGGMCDFTVQTLVSGGSGIIAGGANVFPKVCARVWNLQAAGQTAEAEQLQKRLAAADWFLTKTAIAGTKKALQLYFDYGGYARLPLPRVTAEQEAWIKAGIADLIKEEEAL